MILNNRKKYLRLKPNNETFIEVLFCEYTGNIIYKKINLKINSDQLFDLKVITGMDSYSILENLYLEEVRKNRDLKISKLLNAI